MSITTDTGVAFDMIAELNAARDRLDRDVALLNRALDLRQKLEMGFDLDDMRAEVDAFDRACVVHKRAVEAHRRQQ